MYICLVHVWHNHLLLDLSLAQTRKVAPHFLLHLIRYLLRVMKKKIGRVCLLVLLFILIVMIFIEDVDIKLRKTNLIQQFNLRNNKKILFWTKFYGVNWIKDDYNLCNCFITTNRQEVESSSAVVFMLRDLNLTDLPSFKQPNQMFVLFHVESPCHTYLTDEENEWINDNIDWFMTYRTDSDIYTPSARKLSKPTMNQGQTLSTNKTKMAAWFVSNCNPCSKRDKFVKELQKYIPVDVYGHCGQLECSRDDEEKCYKMVETEYKFYLSFENSICKEYITEKLFNIFNYSVIPVVLGPSGDYANLLPDHSIIDALNFSSTAQLAEYLVHVAGDE